MLNQGIGEICHLTYGRQNSSDGIYALKEWNVDRNNLHFIGEVNIETRE